MLDCSRWVGYGIKPKGYSHDSLRKSQIQVILRDQRLVFRQAIALLSGWGMLSPPRVSVIFGKTISAPPPQALGTP